MREIIARTPIANALSDGKQDIEYQTKELLQEILDSYGAGIRIVLVQLLRVDPLSKLLIHLEMFKPRRPIKKRKLTKLKHIKMISSQGPEVKLKKLIQKAEGYKQSVISDAIGQTKDSYRYIMNTKKQKLLQLEEYI